MLRKSLTDNSVMYANHCKTPVDKNQLQQHKNSLRRSHSLATSKENLLCNLKYNKKIDSDEKRTLLIPRAKLIEEATTRDQRLHLHSSKESSTRYTTGSLTDIDASSTMNWPSASGAQSKYSSLDCISWTSTDFDHNIYYDRNITLTKRTNQPSTKPRTIRAPIPSYSFDNFIYKDEQYSSSDFDANNNLDEVNLRNENILRGEEFRENDIKKVSTKLDNGKEDEKVEKNKSHSHNYIKEFLETQRGSKKPLQNFITKKLSRKCGHDTNLIANQFHSLSDMPTDQKSVVVEKRFIINIGKYFDIKAEAPVPWTDYAHKQKKKKKEESIDVANEQERINFNNEETGNKQNHRPSIEDLKEKLTSTQTNSVKPATTKVQMAKLLFEPKAHSNKNKRISPLIKKTCSYFENPSTTKQRIQENPSSRSKLKKKARSFGTADLNSLKCLFKRSELNYKKPGRNTRKFNDDELPNPDKVRRTRQFFEESCKKQTTERRRSFISLETNEKFYEISDVEQQPQYVSEDILTKIREYGTTITYYGGRIVDQYLGQPILTKAIMNEIEADRKRFRDYPAKYNVEGKQKNRRKPPMKFKLIKYNSCDSRIELLGMNNVQFEVERVRIHPK